MRALACALHINTGSVMCNFIRHMCNIKLYAFWCLVARVFTPRVCEVAFELYCIYTVYNIILTRLGKIRNFKFD